MKVSTGGTRVLGVSSTSYPANAPIEDRHNATRAGRAVLASVLDGHGGWQCSEFVNTRLLRYVEEEDRQGGGWGAGSAAGAAKAYGAALTRAYERTEREWMSHVTPAFSVGFGQTAKVGSCALTVAVLPESIVVANAGDCRAVLARRGGKGVEGVVLSRDHNAREPEEKEKLMADHPGEDNVVVCKHPTACYTKGRLQPTRSFGDLYLKHSEFNVIPGDSVRNRFIQPPYTPPYITASPEVRAFPSDPDRDLFVVLGSDGLWDAVESQEAVEFVAASLKNGQNPATVAELLARHCLAKQAAGVQLSLDNLLQIAPGTRRNYHDDVTVLVVYLDAAASTFGVARFADHDSAAARGAAGSADTAASSTSWLAWIRRFFRQE
jgi:pyruvate dehydrogenase phosphatase